MSVIHLTTVVEVLRILQVVVGVVLQAELESNSVVKVENDWPAVMPIVLN